MINLLAGFFSGIVGGMGIGGGAVLIPALVFIEGVGQQTAQGINLTYFVPTAAFALAVHIKNRAVCLKTAWLLGASGALGAAGGALLATVLSGELLRRAFGAFLLLVGVYEIFKGFKTAPEK